MTPRLAKKSSVVKPRRKTRAATAKQTVSTAAAKAEITKTAKREVEKKKKKRKRKESLSYGPPWAHYLGGYQDRLLGGPLGLPDLCRTVPDGVRHKDYGGEVLR
jgi:hypothetical protein